MPSLLSLVAGGRRSNEAVAETPGLSRGARGHSRLPGQPPPLPPPQEFVASWEAISLGKKPVPEYFDFAHDALDVWSQPEKVKATTS